MEELINECAEAWPEGQGSLLKPTMVEPFNTPKGAVLLHTCRIL